MMLRRGLLSLLVLLALLPAAAQQPKFETRFSSKAKASMTVVGDVNDVLQGRVKPTDFLRADLRGLLFAAGAGTVGTRATIGEMMAIPGRVYVKSVVKPYPVETSTSRFTTPFCFALPKG